MEPIKVKIIRSARKTLAVEVRPEGVIVRAPRLLSNRQIERFVQEHRDWIEKKWAKVQEAARKRKEEEEKGTLRKLSFEDLKKLAEQAKKVIPGRVRYYAPQIGVTYGRITIRAQKTRWGSCSAKGNLNFNCLLMLTPQEVLDSVVVHELCHRKEMNHSARLYGEVRRVFPEYDRWHRWLKINGSDLLAMLPE